ncbi:hypothetical protein B0H19DRAFT_1370758 [Mycena capillaripes]|nr:hypothetical protein B0H19DRAFT_1370758 [Mycena capillaripes]
MTTKPGTPWSWIVEVVKKSGPKRSPATEGRLSGTTLHLRSNSSGWSIQTTATVSIGAPSPGFCRAYHTEGWRRRKKTVRFKSSSAQRGPCSNIILFLARYQAHCCPETGCSQARYQELYRCHKTGRSQARHQACSKANKTQSHKWEGEASILSRENKESRYESRWSRRRGGVAGPPPGGLSADVDAGTSNVRKEQVKDIRDFQAITLRKSDFYDYTDGVATTHLTTTGFNLKTKTPFTRPADTTCEHILELNILKDVMESPGGVCDQIAAKFATNLNIPDLSDCEIAELAPEDLKKRNDALEQRAKDVKTLTDPIVKAINDKALNLVFT